MQAWGKKMTTIIAEPRFGDIDLFRQYLEDVEGFLEDEAQKYHEQLEELERKRREAIRTLSKAVAAGEEIVPPPPDQGLQEEAEEYYRYEQLEMMAEFTNILRKSFFASLYGFFESWLIAECRSLRRKRAKTSPTPDFGSDITGRVKTYLTRELQIAFPFGDSPEWNEIQGYRTLRNCIVHNEGKVTGSRREADIRQYIGQKTTLSLSAGAAEKVILHKGFCEEVLDTIEKFFYLDNVKLGVFSPGQNQRFVVEVRE
jgi:hypothetical protein